MASPSLEVKGTSVRWRAYGAALLPLALAGVLPWWGTALLCVIFALGVHFPVWAEGRLLISLLVVGVVVLLQLLGAAQLGQDVPLLRLIWDYLAGLYLQQLVGVALLSWAVSQLEDNRWTGLLLVLLAGLFTPQAGLVAALVGAALMRSGPDDRLFNAWQTRELRLPWIVGIAGLTLLAVAVLLPRGQVQLGTAGSHSPQSGPTAAVPRPEPPAASPFPSDEPGRVKVPVGWQSSQSLPSFPSELILVAALAVVLSFFLLFREFPTRRGRPPNLVEILMSAGLLLTFVVFLVLALAPGAGNSGGQTQGALVPPPGAGSADGELGPDGLTRSLTGLMNLLLWLAFLVYVGIAAALLWMWWRLRAERRGNQQPGMRDLPSEALEAQPPALHRVRLAYLQAQELLAASGRGRAQAETPQGYAARLSAQEALLAGPLGILTRAYQPVRYGGRVTEDDAAGAEAAVQELGRILPGLPRPLEDPHLPQNANPTQSKDTP